MPQDHDEEDEAEDAWIAQERRKIEDYLAREGVDHLGVGEYPAFHVPPCFALWAVQSKKQPEHVGWWAIGGDLPTDYLSRADAGTPREALAAFARIWREAADSMERGERHPTIAIGTPEDWPELGRLLRLRAEFFAELASDDEAWGEE